MDNNDIIELLDILYGMVTEAWGVPLGNDKCIIEREKAIEIINDIKGSSYPVTERSIDVQILSIRKKLAEAAGNPAAANMIEPVRGVGYRFVEELDLDGH